MPAGKLRRCIEEGMSVLVGTVDAANEPSCCRGVAFTADEEFTTATVYVPVATGQETVANVATTRRLAVLTSHPIDHLSIQLKGTTTVVRLASESENALVHQKLDAFFEILEQIGIPRRVTGKVNSWPAFAIEMNVVEIYDQTPGPNAGTLLQ